MNDLFAPPGNEWRPVSPQLGRMRRTVLAVLVAVAVVVSLTAGLVLGLLGWFGTLAALWLVLGAAAGW